MNTTQPSLLSRVRDLHDHQAWREFDAKYRELILRYCLRKGLQQSDAEDVRQLVMLNLARQLRSFEYDPARGRFRSYLGRATANAIHRYFRSPRAEKRGLDTSVASSLPAEDDPRLDQEWEAEWMLHHYRLAMDTVRKTADPKSVEIFERLLAGEESDAVATALRTSRDAVHKVKQRMRDRLKLLVEKQIHEEEDLGTRPA